MGMKRSIYALASSCMVWRYKCAGMYPARMYIIVIFACIGTEMKCSALEFYAMAVYWGIRGIYNGKPQMKAMRLFMSVAAALLQRFLSIKQNTFNGIEQYSKQFINIQLLHTRWIITIHHECPCRKEISHPRGQILTRDMACRVPG